MSSTTQIYLVINEKSLQPVLTKQKTLFLMPIKYASVAKYLLNFCLFFE